MGELGGPQLQNTRATDRLVRQGHLRAEIILLAWTKPSHLVEEEN